MRRVVKANSLDGCEEEEENETTRHARCQARESFQAV